MRTNLVVLPLALNAEDLAISFRATDTSTQRLFPVVDGSGRLAGIITAKRVQQVLDERPEDGVSMWLNRTPVSAFPDEPLRAVVNRMAEHGLTRLPVVASDDPTRLFGMISLRDLLQARARNLMEERHRERMLRVRLLGGGAGARRRLSRPATGERADEGAESRQFP